MALISGNVRLFGLRALHLAKIMWLNATKRRISWRQSSGIRFRASTLKLEAAVSYETPVTSFQNTRHRILQQNNMRHLKELLFNFPK